MRLQRSAFCGGVGGARGARPVNADQALLDGHVRDALNGVEEEQHDRENRSGDGQVDLRGQRAKMTVDARRSTTARRLPRSACAPSGEGAPFDVSAPPMSGPAIAATPYTIPTKPEYS